MRLPEDHPLYDPDDAPREIPPEQMARFWIGLTIGGLVLFSLILVALFSGMNSFSVSHPKVHEKAKDVAAQEAERSFRR